jgi:predicted nucleic acid-binding protein
MPQPIVVPDASVLLKWTLESDNDEDRGQALALKEAWLSGACRIVVPSLWVYEVGNILAIKEPRFAATLLRAVIDLEMEERKPDVYLGDIYSLTGKYKVTFYDAAYHGLAINSGGTFLTADAAYVRKAQRAGHIRSLRGWQGPRSQEL